MMLGKRLIRSVSNSRGISSFTSSPYSVFWNLKACPIPQTTTITTESVLRGFSGLFNVREPLPTIRITGYADMFSRKSDQKMLTSLSDHNVSLCHVEDAEHDVVNSAIYTDFLNSVLGANEPCQVVIITDDFDLSYAKGKTRVSDSIVTLVVPSTLATAPRGEDIQRHWEQVYTGSFTGWPVIPYKIPAFPLTLAQSVAYDRQLQFIDQIKSKLRVMLNACGRSMTVAKAYTEFERRYKTKLRFAPNQFINPGEELPELQYFITTQMAGEININSRGVPDVHNSILTI